MIPQEHWLTLEPYIDHALDLTAGEQAAYIAELRRRDPSLAGEVARFVAECGQPDARLDDSAPARFSYLLDDTAPAPLPTDALLAGRYRIEREIGRGGMALVYLARDAKLHDRTVAVKVMRRSRLTSQSATRFLEEIRLTGTLRHPNIVPVYDADEFEDRAFFVMPHIDGETLRDRLAREKTARLPISDVLRIGIDVARALAYAHAHGIVHRDVKPSNLLLASGVAMLADFGIAHDATPNDFHTDGGIRLGTPAYMSPEQSDPRQVVDAQTDIYSLGCVLYEMITGVKPTPAAQRLNEARRGLDPVRPMRELRREVSPRLEACVASAMALKKHSRTPGAADLVRALEACARDYGVTLTPWKRLYWRWPKHIAAAASVLAAAAAAGGYALVRHRAIAAPTTLAAATVPPTGGGSLDTSRIAIFSFEHHDGSGPSAEEADQMRDALTRWDGVNPVDRVEMHNALAGRDSSRLTPTDIGRAVRAARYVRVETARDGDSLSLRAGLYDSRTGTALANALVTTHADRRRAMYDSLADRLLFPGVPESTVVRLRTATHSRPALQAYVKSLIEINAWDLAAADSSLTNATTYDPQFALAYLWLAQVRSWREMDPATWRFAAHHAATARPQLDAHDRLVADALAATAANDSAGGCAIWRRLTTRPGNESDFGAWYAAARCDYFDKTVVRDPRSPSGWAFRASYEHATRSFEKAFEILPAIHREFRSSWYTSLKSTLRTQRLVFRGGVAAPPDTGHFAAFPSWSATGDTLEFVPYRMATIAAVGARVIAPSWRTAVEHQRKLFLRIATTWRNAFGPNSDALLAVAMALDPLGDPTALDSVHLARRLAEDAGDPAARLRAGAAEVWMLVKYGVPNDIKRLEAARELADTLLGTFSDVPIDSTQAMALASLAVLTGRANVAARFSRENRGTQDLVASPPSLRPTIRALDTYAALGAPIDSIRNIAQALRAVPMPDLDRRNLMRRALRIAFPSYQDTAVRELARSGDVLAGVETAWLDHDTTKIRQGVGPFRNRRDLEPEDVQLEALYPNAWLLASIGDPGGALDWLAPTLDAQSRSAAETLRSPVAAAMLLRTMVLRAQLANQLGRKSEAAQWALAIVTLWAHADDPLRPLLKEMKRLAR